MQANKQVVMPVLVMDSSDDSYLRAPVCSCSPCLQELAGNLRDPMSVRAYRAYKGLQGAYGVYRGIYASL